MKEAAALIGIDPKTLMWWERNIRPPVVHQYPTIIRYLGYEPWPEPATLAEALVAERRRRGLGVKVAAPLVGVDEGTWLRWERGEWRPTRRTLDAIDRFLGFSARERFPSDVLYVVRTFGTGGLSF